MSEQLPPERAVRLLRATVGELEEWVRNSGVADPTDYLAAKLSLVAELLADHIEDHERHFD